VVRIACEQPAFTEVIVRRQFERIVGREPSKRDVRDWGQALSDDPAVFTTMVQEWVLSPVYAERLQSLRLKSDRQFLRGLMVDLTGELPDAETEARARTALAAVADAGPLRSVIARVLLGRHGAGLPERGKVDAYALIDSLFHRFLGREPGPDERAALAIAYEQCECEPDTVALSLITHWEYQYY